MQSLHPLTADDFKVKTKEVVNKLEIFIECCAFDLCDFYGKDYMLEARYSKGQKEFSYQPVAATFEAVIDNTDGLFHPKNKKSPFNDYLKVGRRMIFSTGFKKDGVEHLWQWFDGVVAKVQPDTKNRVIIITGFDYTQYLSDVELKSPNNYWGTFVIKSAVKDKAEYSMPEDCNGPYIAYLDGSQIYNEKHWVYDRDSNKFILLPAYVPTENGTNNLKIYYYTDQVPENVVADILVTAGLYPNRESALANMDYVETGKIIKRVGFESGSKALGAIKKICEYADYQFLFKYENTPVFKPIVEVDKVRWENRIFTFDINLIDDQEYEENTDEIKNHIIIKGEKYSTHDQIYEILSGSTLLDSVIEERHVGEVVADLPYETQGLISLNRDIIVPFYIPSTMLSINYVYLNFYFPGLQQGDYPDNVDEIYLPHYYAPCKTYEVMNGNVAGAQGWVPHRISGNGIDAGNYFWYRWFFKFDISPYMGLNLNFCKLKWVLGNVAKAGSGPNTEIPLQLHGLADYGMLTRDDWGMATDQDFGNVNQHNDPLEAEYEKDIKSWAQSKFDAGWKALCFRMKGATEHTDVNNANQYYTGNHQLHLKVEEDTNAPVSIYGDNGAGFGASLGSYNTDQEEMDLTDQFSGAGKKRLKFTCAKTRRIDILIRVGLTLNKE